MQQIAKVSAANFQSIEAASVDLGLRENGGGITTFTGPSSTGKSALLRAVRMAVRNTGSGQVRAGAKSARVTVTDADEVSVTATRGKSLSTYEVSRPDEEPVVYSKAGTTVPETVARLLGFLSADPDPHFSFQFDRPYLLSEPGSVVSRVIGELTNANVLAYAVREGARRKLRASQMASTRAQDAKGLVERIRTEYSGLGSQEAAHEEAGELLARARDIVGQASVISDLARAHSNAAMGLRSIKSQIEAVPNVTPMLDEAAQILSNAERLRRLAEKYEATSQEAEEAAHRASEEARKAALCGDKYHKMLLKLGTCPTCGVDTSHRHDVA